MSTPRQTWKAIGVAGSVVGPCGMATPLVLDEDGSILRPLDAERPRMRHDELNRAATEGHITLLTEQVDIPTGHKLAWVTNALLSASKETEGIWSSLRSRGIARSRFDVDHMRDAEVILAPASVMVEAFDRLEQSVVTGYVRGFIEGRNADDLLARFEPGLRAALFASSARPNRRLDTLRHLGHLYRISGLEQKLESLHQLKVSGPPFRMSYEDFLTRIARLADTLNTARENAAAATRLRQDNEPSAHEAEAMVQGSPRPSSG